MSWNLGLDSSPWRSLGQLLAFRHLISKLPSANFKFPQGMTQRFCIIKLLGTLWGENHLEVGEGRKKKDPSSSKLYSHYNRKNTGLSFKSLGFESNSSCSCPSSPPLPSSQQCDLVKRLLTLLVFIFFFNEENHQDFSNFHEYISHLGSYRFMVRINQLMYIKLLEWLAHNTREILALLLFNIMRRFPCHSETLQKYNLMETLKYLQYDYTYNNLIIHFLIFAYDIAVLQNLWM